MAVCDICCIDLNKILKILDMHFSYNKKLKKEKNYNTVRDIHQVLKIWKMRNLTLKGKIVSFDTIVIPKIVFQSFMTTAQKYIVNDLEKIKKAF